MSVSGSGPTALSVAVSAIFPPFVSVTSCDTVTGESFTTETPPLLTAIPIVPSTVVMSNTPILLTWKPVPAAVPARFETCVSIGSAAVPTPPVARRTALVATTFFATPFPSTIDPVATMTTVLFAAVTWSLRLTVPPLMLTAFAIVEVEVRGAPTATVAESTTENRPPTVNARFRLVKSPSPGSPVSIASDPAKFVTAFVS